MDEGAFWRHSLLTAKAAEFVTAAARTFSENPAVGYTAGLLHDIGKLVLNQFLVPQSRGAMERVIRERGEAGIAAEREVLGVDHAEAGALLLRKWSLPGPMIGAIAFHHEPEMIPFPRLSAVVALADAIAHMVDSGSSGVSGPMLQALIKSMGLDQDGYERILGTTSEALVQIEGLAELN
jgi:putative nucleotidyltransferase with HDIG domain